MLLLPDIRIGNGYDVHRLCKGRRLVLGGVEILSELGLDGHSDADVLLHSIIDAVLGALSWGDIGQWFPPTDVQFKDADSKRLFSEVWNKAQANGWELINRDSVVIAEQPKLAPYIKPMREVVAGLFGVSSDRVSVKATTTEHLGFIGRSEGIAASSVVLLKKRSI